MRRIIIIGVFVGKRGEDSTTVVRRRRLSVDNGFECPNVYESERSARITVVRNIVPVQEHTIKGDIGKIRHV